MAPRPVVTADHPEHARRHLLWMRVNFERNKIIANARRHNGKPFCRSRRPRVGLSDPRGARGQANEEEGVRLAREAGEVRRALREIQDDGAMSLDLPDSELLDSEEHDSDYSDESDANPQPPIHPIPSPRAAIPATRPARSNWNLWHGNNPKLNLIASKFRRQPLRQEIAVTASRSQDLKDKILSLKRDPNQDFDFGNLKHSGKKFLIEKTTAELNECEQFQIHMPAGAQMNPEYLRQKIKEFFDIAIATPVDRIDIRNISRLIVFLYPITVINTMIFMQIVCNGSSISGRYMKKRWRRRESLLPIKILAF
jgi:hypothetical protein